jgi:hypothetical protein
MPNEKGHRGMPSSRLRRNIRRVGVLIIRKRVIGAIRRIPRRNGRWFAISPDTADSNERYQMLARNSEECRWGLRSARMRRSLSDCAPCNRAENSGRSRLSWPLSALGCVELVCVPFSFSKYLWFHRGPIPKFLAETNCVKPNDSTCKMLICKNHSPTFSNE